MSPYDILVQVRARYGPVWDAPGVEHKPYLTQAQLGALLNEVAWRAGYPWGLSAKPNGYNVPQPVTGRKIASDILQRADTGELFDCLLSAGERSEPTWAPAEPHHDPNRPWVAPVDPSVPVDPPPPPPPPDTSLPLVLAKLASLSSEVERLAARVEQVAVRMEELFQRTAWPLKGRMAGLTISGQVGPNRPEEKR